MRAFITGNSNSRVGLFPEFLGHQDNEVVPVKDFERKSHVVAVQVITA
jgi:hypothetical protein